MSRLNIFNLSVNFSNKKEILTAIGLASSATPVTIGTINPEFILEAKKNLAFREALQKMSHCIVDGTGLFFFLKSWNFLHGANLELERYPGATLVEDLFIKYADGEKSFFFLGGPTGLAENAGQEIKKRYPHINIIGVHNGGTLDPEKPILPEEVIDLLQKTQPDILLVGFGAPKQELWITQQGHTLNIPVLIGIGGTLGFYTTKKRAPLFMRTLGLEWLYRSLTERGHFRRAWRATVVFSFYALPWLFHTEQKTN